VPEGEHNEVVVAVQILSRVGGSRAGASTVLSCALPIIP
jgi:hypothetical protein